MHIENLIITANEFYEKTYGVQIKTAMRRKKLTMLMEKPGTFGVLSGYIQTSRIKNRARHGALLGILNKHGFRTELISGMWKDTETKVEYAEQSYLVYDIPFCYLMAISEEFAQQAFIYKSDDGIIGMYYPSKKVAELAVDINAHPSYKISLGKDLWSKLRGLSFEFNFLSEQYIPWDGNAFFTKGQVVDFIKKGLLKPEALV